MEKRTIFFDLDDTLYDRSVPYGRAFSAFFGGEYADRARAAFERTMQRGYEVFKAAHTGQITMEAMHIYRHQTGLRDVGIEVTVEQALQMQALYEEQQRQIRLTDTMRQILTLCAARFAAVGVITNGGVQSQKEKLASLGVGEWVRPELVLISDEVGVMKPSAEIFRLAEQRAGTTAARCVYVGDSLSQDIAGAGGCGWETVWLDRKGETAGAVCPTLTVRSEAALLEALRRMAERI